MRAFLTCLTDLSNDQGSSKDLIGWYGIPQVNLTKHIGVLADFVSSFNEHTGGSAVANGLHSNTRSFTAGPVYMLPIGKKDCAVCIRRRRRSADVNAAISQLESGSSWWRWL